MYLLRYVTTLLLTGLAVMTAKADFKSLDKYIESLEHVGGVEITLNERHDPDTHELVSSSMIVAGNQTEIFDKLVELMQSCRDEATSYNRIKDALYTVVRVKSQSNSATRLYVTYTLMRRGGGRSWLLTVSSKSRPRAWLADTDVMRLDTVY